MTDNMNDTLNTIVARIERLKTAERVTKVELSAVSREVLDYIVVQRSDDIDTVNRLLAVLTPMNKNMARLYFGHFLPFKLQEEGGFTTKIKGDKKLDKNLAMVIEWLSDADNDIWLWADRNIEMKAPKPFAERIEGVVKQALEGIEANKSREAMEAIPPEAILKAVLAAGIKPADLLNIVDALDVDTDAVHIQKDNEAVLH